jgi:hypothetical protein
MGRSYELLGKQEEAQRFYDQAARLGAVHQLEEQGTRISRISTDEPYLIRAWNH